MSAVLSRLEPFLTDRLDMLCIREDRSRSKKIREFVKNAIADYEAKYGQIEIDQKALEAFRSKYKR